MCILSLSVFLENFYLYVYGAVECVNKWASDSWVFLWALLLLFICFIQFLFDNCDVKTYSNLFCCALLLSLRSLLSSTERQKQNGS